MRLFKLIILLVFLCSLNNNLKANINCPVTLHLNAWSFYGGNTPYYGNLFFGGISKEKFDLKMTRRVDRYPFYHAIALQFGSGKEGHYLSAKGNLFNLWPKGKLIWWPKGRLSRVIGLIVSPCVELNYKTDKITRLKPAVGIDMKIIQLSSESTCFMQGSFFYRRSMESWELKGSNYIGFTLGIGVNTFHNKISKGNRHSGI